MSEMDSIDEMKYLAKMRDKLKDLMLESREMYKNVDENSPNFVECVNAHHKIAEAYFSVKEHWSKTLLW